MKREKGITLQALVITIIIMLILTGVTVVSLGDSYSGIIKAKKKEEKKFDKELNTTQRSVTDLNTTWEDVTDKKGIEKELVFNEETNDLYREN